MKPRDLTESKRLSATTKLPRGVIQRAANRVGLTRKSLQCVAGLVMAGLSPGPECR